MKVAFVTVGSTQFPELVQAVLHEHALSIFKNLGYTRLIVQHGSYTPNTPKIEKLSIECFAYTNDLAEYIRIADLIISHAGAGTAIEVLRARKKLIMVPNETLLDNHQVELAEKLSSSSYCLSCKPQDVMRAVQDSSKIEFLPFPTFDQDVIDSIFA